MLNSFVLPASVSSGLAVEGVPQVQGYAPHNQLAKLLPAFKSAEDGSKPEDEEKQNQQISFSEVREVEGEQLPEIFRLAFNVSFREMIEYFLIPDHEKIIDIRSRIRTKRGISNLTIISPVGSVPNGFDELRNQLYEFQMQLFSTPKGLHCHIII